jgi:PAS domain S-box-containing protein
MTAARWSGPAAIAAFVALACGCTAIALWGASVPPASDLALACFFATAMTLAWLRPLPLTDKTKLYLDTSVTIGAILYFPAGIAMLVAGVGTILGQSFRRQPWDQAVFNSAQTMLQAASGAVVLAAAGWDVNETLNATPLHLVAIGAASVVVSVVNLLAVATVVGLQTGSPVPRVVSRTLRSLTASEFLGQGVQVCLGVIAAALAATAPWAVALLMAPAAAVYRVLLHNIELRRHLAATLREREVTLADAERVAQLGSWEWQLATHDQRWSDEMFRILGMRPGTEAPSIQTFVQYVHPDDRVILEMAIQDALETSTAFELRHRVLRADGNERSVRTHGMVIHDAAGQPARLVGTVHDISDRLALETQLLQQDVPVLLTTREVEVLNSLARGNANKEIAVQLGISEQTVKNHVTSILRKLRVNDRTQAVVVAMRHGWIDLDVAAGDQPLPGR